MAFTNLGQNGYVTFARSSEYRKLLWDQYVKFHNAVFGWCVQFILKQKIYLETAAYSKMIAFRSMENLVECLLEHVNEDQHFRSIINQIYDNI